ncbi:gamma-glutamylcyclotransferase family protein [Labedella endophytica]|uniref:Gamma-glutamylcyclotransferase n=1 Tax=Labedella endophytica TaxID=1523160 RepID=A0A3S0X7G6_9MICO|nr:gamma-glutamylcyclotransferase family protein [Labedella endophytica]RUR01110.1 gamma-glutamylcyclotransferase [Labedella endophytica]
MTESHALFSYGTLRYPSVQLSTFGRELPTTEDALPGFVVSSVVITDEHVLAVSGTDVHPALVWTGSPDDVVRGAVLDVTTAELDAADTYEVDDYVRIAVRLASGRHGWAYVHRDGRPPA